MSPRHRTAIALALASALGMACGGNDRVGSVREADADEQRRAGVSAPIDQEVVEALKVPQVPGRILYDPPSDLSLANAVRTRPDLVGGDSTAPDITRASGRRDTMAGDATADTSGGAARRRRP